MLYEISGFRFLPYKTYEFVKEHVPPRGESISHYKTVEFVPREAHRSTKSLYFIVGGEFPRGESSSQYKSYIITLRGATRRGRPAEPSQLNGPGSEIRESRPPINDSCWWGPVL